MMQRKEAPVKEQLLTEAAVSVMKRFITILLLTSLILSSLVSCGGSSGGTDTTASGEPGETTAPVETGPVSRDKTPDTLPADLDFGGETIGVMFPQSHGGTADQIDWAAEDTGDLVVSAVYNRQSSVEERLNVKFDVISGDTVSGWADKVRSEVMAGGGAYDLVWGPQSVTTPLLLDGLYLDLSDAKYIDYSQPWWNTALMDEFTVGGRRPLLAGDISLSILSYTSCIYFNKEAFSSITGRTDNDLYQLVLDGRWTMDQLAEYCKLCYRDVNGDTTYDDADQYGMGAVTASTTDHMTYDAGIRCTTRGKDGVPVFTMNNEQTVKYADKLYNLLYNNPGVHVYKATQDTLRITLPNKLMNGEVAFMCGYFYSASLLRDMKTDYGIIPYPKLDETIDHYGALVHDSAMLVSVPVTCDCKDAVMAAIEAIAAENYRTVTPAYYEVALKTKYVRDDISGQIIDMIHDACTTDFAYVHNNNLNSIGHIMRQLAEAKSADFASTYAKLLPAAEESLAKLVRVFEDMK